MDGVLFIRDLAVVMIIAGGVGWLFQRLRLSVVVGYLIAGIIIGPDTPPFALVSDLDRVQTLAQLGLVFLIFSIGLGLSFARIRRLGVSVVGATIIGAILVLNVSRLFGYSMGWSGAQSLFLAGMLMVSSSAIISKVLEELNATHHRSGQLALGITVLEDIVAVVMLTLLTSMVQVGKAETAAVWSTIGSLSAFVVFLVFAALLSLPRLLRYLGRVSTPEVRTIVVAGLVLFVAFIGVRIGFSMALGAFILGVVIAGTRHGDEVERSFESLRSIFGAVFFVAMGMLLDVRLLVQSWGLVLAVTALVVVVRPLACAIGLMAMGNSTGESVKAGVVLIPIGEFSFVIAQLGVSSGMVPELFYPVAVGVSLGSAIVAPMIARYSEPIGAWVERHQPAFVRDGTTLYNEWLEALAGRRQRSILWRLTGKRILQTALQVLFASALVLFVNPVYRALAARLGDQMTPAGFMMVFWAAFGIVLLAPLIAIWRNVDALAMIFSEGATQRSPRKARLRPLIQGAIKIVVGAVLAIWLMVLLPFGASLLWVALIVVAIMAGVGALFWRRFIQLHSKLEVEIRERIRKASAPAVAKGLPEVLADHNDWNLRMDEVTIPPQSEHAGRSIGELALRKRLGCSIVGIDRQGYMISTPGAGDVLYPGDKVLLLGTEEQLSAAEHFLRSGERADGEMFEDLTTETVEVPEASGQLGRTLAELDLVGRFGVQVCGIRRGAKRIVIPSGTEIVCAGDRLFVLGTHDRIQDCRAFLA